MKKVMEYLFTFHTTYRAHVATKIGFPDAKTRKLRRKLIREEYLEFIDAEEADDLVEVADALADIIYVVAGTAVSYGIPLEEIFDEVQLSNMSKLDENGEPIFREDGKILKGPNFFEPKIKAIMEKYGYKG